MSLKKNKIGDDGMKVLGQKYYLFPNLKGLYLDDN